MGILSAKEGPLPNPVAPLAAGRATLVLVAAWLFAASAVVCFGQELGESRLDDSSLWDAAEQQAELRQLASLVKKGELQRAAQLADHLLAGTPEDPWILFSAGYVQFRQKQYWKAIIFFSEAEKRAPRLPNLAKYLAICYSRINQRVLFERQIGKAIELAPDDPEVHSIKGQRLALYDPARAIISFNRVLELRHLDYRSWCYRGYAYERVGEKKKARQDFLQSIELMERDGIRTFGSPYLGMAILLIDEAPSEALPYVLKAVEVEPEVEDNHFLLGKVYWRLDRIPDAIAAFQRVTELDATAVESWYWLYRLYLNAGKSEAAETSLAEFLRLSNFKKGH